MARTLEDVLAKVDWQLLSQLLKKSEGQRYSRMPALKTEQNEALGQVGASYSRINSDMLQFPIALFAARSELPGIEVEDSFQPETRIGIRDFDLAKALLESSARHAASYLRERLGEDAESRIAEAIDEWYGESRILPNALSHFGNAAAFASILPESSARQFLGFYSPIFFDEAFIDTARASLAHVIKEEPDILPLVMRLLARISRSSVRKGERPVKYYRDAAEGETEGLGRLVGDFFGEALDEGPTLPSEYLMITGCEEAQLFWKTSLEYFSRLHRLGVLSESRTFMDFVERAPLPTGFLAAQNFAVALENAAGHSQPLSQALADINASLHYLGRLRDEVLFNSYNATLPNRFLNLVKAGAPHELMDKIVSHINELALGDLINVYISMVFAHYSEHKDFRATLEFAEAVSDRPLVGLVKVTGEELRDELYVYGIKRILEHGDYARMISFLNSINPGVASKLMARISEEELVYKLGEAFGRETELPDAGRSTLDKIIKESSSENIDALLQLAGKQTFSGTLQRLQFILLARLLLNMDSQKYLPVLVGDLAAIGPAVLGEFKEDYGWQVEAGPGETDLEAALRLVEDATVPNVDFVVKQKKEHGSLKASFKHNRDAAQTVQLLAANGYDTEFYVASGALVATASDGFGERYDWKAPFNLLISSIVGSRKNRQADVYIPGSPPGRIFRAIRPDYEAAAGGDRAAALQVVDKILGIITTVPDAKRSRPVEELHDQLSGLRAQIEANEVRQGGTLTARVWNRDVPDSLYHNESLACCIFLPKGEHRDEAPLFLMDPQTTMVEYHLNGKGRVSVATLYAGRHGRLLMDTWEANQGIYSILGNRKTKRFVLDSLVMAALRALPGTERPELVIFDCKYGRSLELVNYLREVMRHDPSIAYSESVGFQAVDIEDLALTVSQGRKHHYTDAFGIDKPLSGAIRAFVIDAKAYAAGNGLMKEKQPAFA